METRRTETRVSFYATVLNEEKSIDAFLQSLSRQSRPPDEIIIVDGGSVDGTRKIVERYAARGLPIRLISLPGSNVAEARNAGFRTARYEHVASSDAGCRLHPQWLANLLKGVRDGIDIVSGVFLPEAKSRFEASVGDLMYDDVNRLPDDWSMPSHRSVLIRKAIWEALGGFPSYLYRSEDTWFNLEARKRGFRFRLARDAIVYWRPRQTLADVFRNSYLWTRADTEFNIHGAATSFAAICGLLRLSWKAIAFLSGVAILLAVPLPLSLLPLPFLMRAIVTPYPRERTAYGTLAKNAIHLCVDTARTLGWISGGWRKAWRTPSEDSNGPATPPT